jgi:hypothetical protein
MAILRDVGETLRNLLIEQKIPNIKKEGIVFDSPADITAANEAKLSIYLYRVVENTHFRNVEPEQIGLDKLQPPPITLDLYYLFTPICKEIATELIILESLMQILYDFSVLKGDLLEDSLKNSGNNGIKIVPNNFIFEETSKLWEGFRNKDYKLSVSYILGPVRIPSGKPIATITRVLEKNINMHRLEVEK